MKQSTLTLALHAASILLIGLSILSFLFIVQSSRSAEKAASARYDLIVNAKRFMAGSAYLTNEVRAYAATGDAKHQANYLDEVNRHRNRDISVDNMRKAGITPDEETLVTKMFSLSNNLIPLEKEAMRLSREGRQEEALEAVFGKAYEDWITQIKKAQLDFIDMLHVRTEAQLEAEREKMHAWMGITVGCLMVTALMQIVSTVAIRRKVIGPLLLARDKMLHIAKGNLHFAFDAVPDSSEIGMLIGSIQSTKDALSRYISDISDTLASIAGGNFAARVDIDYIGDFSAIKDAINEIAQRLADQHERDERGREELRVAYESANAANRAKSDFLSTMSHEIRTPMNAIIGMANIALSSDSPERREQCLHKIRTASAHLMGVINNILDMSKIDANKFELSPVAFNLEAMLLRVANVIGFRVEEKKQTLNIHIDKGVPHTIMADEQRLAQVITNLLGNAIKFTPEEGLIRLVARLEEQTDRGCTLFMSVQDTGIGIAPEQQRKLFSSFTQADADISRQFGGTGLGLAISKSIISKMDGRIWIESAEGEGATFAFTFCAGYDAAARYAPPALKERAWEEVRILAVDDERDSLEFFRQAAERLGCLCDTATGGAEALQAAASARYDVFFIDWNMPGMDGLELVRRLREQGVADPVVIVSSCSEWFFIEDDARQAGVGAHIPKPLFTSAIADAIAAALGAEAGEQGERRGNALPDFSAHAILLVEDMEINREIVQALLEPTGVAIACAENGAVAVDMIAGNSGEFDMIFMDLHMPEMDGSEATRRIRAMQDPYARQVPIIAMTANVFREDIEECLRIGMNGHIGKPIDMDDVIATMKRYLPPAQR